MLINDSPHACKLTSTLQLISAMMLIPLSLILFVQKATTTLLGGGLQGSDRAHPLMLGTQTHGGMALGLVALILGILSFYVSWQLLQRQSQKLLQFTVLLQGLIVIIEGMKLALGLQGNWLCILTGLFIVGYLLKPQWQTWELRSLWGAVRERLPHPKAVKKKV